MSDQQVALRGVVVESVYSMSSVLSKSQSCTPLASVAIRSLEHLAGLSRLTNFRQNRKAARFLSICACLLYALH